MEEFDQYIPPLWVMCLESVAHLLVMLNFSTNFLIYCSVSAPFKKALSKVTLLHFVVAEIRRKSRKTRLKLFVDSFGVGDAVCFEVRDLTNCTRRSVNTASNISL